MDLLENELEIMTGWRLDLTLARGTLIQDLGDSGGMALQ
jgi:hypothetical protein